METNVDLDYLYILTELLLIRIKLIKIKNIIESLSENDELYI